MIAVWLTLLLITIGPSYQYTYSCNSSVTCGCSSGSQSVTRIVGGETAETNNWGWAVSISIGTATGTALCGGSILSSTWIVTAAHCMSGVAASKVTIYAGSSARFAGQSRVASTITVHPSYNSGTKANDIALIQLGTPLTMSTAVKPVCIPSVSSATLAAGEWPPANLYVVAVGWGTLTEGGSLPLYLQQVTLQTIAYTASTCSNVLNDPQKQLCAGVPGGGKDTCQGDSGGPLTMFTTSNQWELVGLTSYGYGCAEAQAMGVYTRVAYYQSWINQTTSNVYINPTSSISAKIDPSNSTWGNTTSLSDNTFSSSSSFMFFSLLFTLFFLIHL
ncbi:unnamed protein product [Adineta steineri]|uniref:Peptidase S1 domain-containing protein n=1 Tax=Adineta steineri TaxID=433720 RepID=A0A814Y9U1_9BILA|nr:unnamed protein product [Adineta steineri]CAF3649732.1 unnamed protein product [Adineta steineri]